MGQREVAHVREVFRITGQQKTASLAEKAACEKSDGSGLALRELEALAGAGLAGLLALFFARVAHQMAGLLEGGA